MQEEKRIEVIQRVFRDELTVGEAATVLGVSERQCYRIKARVKEQGEWFMATGADPVRAKSRRRRLQARVKSFRVVAQIINFWCSEGNTSL
ncbi:MAG: helix-turn-helix domain-containing protein [Gammaproteobacteria bacterium]